VPAANVSLPSIYHLEKSIHQPSNGDEENSPLMQVEDPDKIFSRALDVELEKISSFYQLKELEIYGEVSEFLQDEESYQADVQDQMDGEGEGDGEPPRPGTSGRMSDRQRRNGVYKSFAHAPRARRASTMSRSVDSDDDDDQHALLQKPRIDRTKSAPYDGAASSRNEDMRASTEFTKSVRRNSQNYDDYANEAFLTFYSSGVTLKKRAIGLYVQLCELKSYIQLNKTGFTKVLKKFDKICDRSLKSKYLKQYVDSATVFQPETMSNLEKNIQRMERAYADVVTHGDVEVAKKELRLHLREHVVWERNTVWREMIGIERKSQAANLGIRRTLLGRDNNPATARLQGDDDSSPEMKELATPIGRFRFPTWIFSSTMITLVILFAIFMVMLYVPILKNVAQQNCLAMLVFVSLLWATEVSQCTVERNKGFFC
jgi:phosphate transporter